MKKKTFASKLVCLLVTLAMLFSLVPATAFAADPVVITLGSEADKVKPGETFTVEVNVTADSNIGAFDYRIEYNGDKFEATKIEYGDAFTQWMMDSMAEGEDIPAAKTNVNLENAVEMSFAHTYPLNVGGCLFKVTFTAREEANLDSLNLVQIVENAAAKKTDEGEYVGTIETLPEAGVPDDSYADIVVVDPDVESISVTNPAKTDYVLGQDTKFDPSGAVVTVNYTNGAHDEFTLPDERISVSTPDLTTEGTKTVTVTYKEKTATFNINVAARKAQSIEIVKDSLPNQTYKQDLSTELNVSGAKMKVTYDNGDIVDVRLSDATLSTPDFSKSGKQTIKVSYAGVETSFDIDVLAKIVDSISMGALPTKTTYVINKDNKLDTTGGKIKVNYKYSATGSVELTEEIDLLADMCNGYNLKKTDTYPVTVQFEGKTIENAFTIEVIKELESIEVTTNPTNLNYVEGKKFDPAGGKVTLKYNDGSSEPRDLTVDMVKGLATDEEGGLVAGTYICDVTVADKTDKGAFTVTVVEKAIASATFTPPTAENQTKYIEGIEGQKLDLTGAKWDIVYNDGDKEPLTILTKIPVVPLMAMIWTKQAITPLLPI